MEGKDQLQLPVMLTVRGTHNFKSLDEARSTHNETAGSKQGMEAARTLSDISHNVYVPARGAGKLTGAADNELLFIDYWTDPQGLQKFFSSPEVHAQGGKLFAKKDPAVWMPARGSFMFIVPAPAGKRAQYVGLLRATVKSPEAAIAAFAKMQQQGLHANRRRGQLGHALYVKLGPPNEPVEITGIDLWSHVEGLVEAYSSPQEMAEIGATLAGPPTTSVWEQATGFNEW